MVKIYHFLTLSLFVVLWFAPSRINAQCPQLLDGSLTFSDEPYWVNCSDEDYFLTLQTDMFVGDYSVDWGDGSAVESGAGLDVGDIFVNHMYLAAVDTFILTFIPDPIAFPGCTITGVVVMEEKATAEIGIPGGIDLSICVPGTFTYVNNTNQTSGKPVSETTTFYWNYGDGSPLDTFDFSNAGALVSHEYLPNNAGCGIVVSLIAENYCGMTINTFGPINTWDVDSANITPSATLLCYPDTTFTFSNTTQMNCQPDNAAQRYEYWNFGDYWGLGYDSIIGWTPWPPTVPNTVGFPGPGTYTVMLLDSSYCGIDTAFQDVTITVAPEVNLTVFPDTICMGESAQFNGTVLANTPDVFIWNFDDGNGWVGLGSGIQNQTYTTAGDFTILFAGAVSSAGSACADTASVPLHVRTAPIPDFILSDNESCDSITVTITENSSGGAVTWDWDFGNGNTSTDQNPPSQSYPSPGTYTIELATGSTNGCISFTQQDIFIWESPVADFLVANACQGGATEFSDQSGFPAADPLTGWQWDYGDGNTGNIQNSTHVYPNLGIYPVELVVSTSHCTDTAVIDVNVEPKPIIGFNPLPDAGCTPLSVLFENTTLGAASYSWDFGDGNGSILEDPVHAYFNFTLIDTVFQVELIAQTAFGCSDTLTDFLSVFSGAVADFTFSTVPNCAPAEITFTQNAINAVSYEWNFGDGTPVSIEENPTHTFENTDIFIKNFTVTLVAFSANGCSDTLQQVISVNPELVLSLDLLPDSGCHPFQKTFPTSTNDGAVAWLWNFGDGHSSINNGPTHTFENPTFSNQVFDVRLVASNAFGCTDTSETQIRVFPKPLAQFNASPPFGCAPLDVDFENESIGQVNSIWNFGDGTDPDTTTDAMVTHLFDNTTSNSAFYPVTLLAISEHLCTDTSLSTIEVYPKVTAGFDVDTSGCSPLNVLFTNQSSGADDYLWDFGDGSNTDTLINVIHTYYNSSSTTDTSFTAILYALSSFNCRDTLYQNIEIFHKPSALSSASESSGCSPLAVELSNLSVGADSYSWSYGDQSPDSITSAITHMHTYYNASGGLLTFLTQLFAYTTYGCSDTASLSITASPQVNASFLPATPLCSPAQVQWTNTSTGASQFIWDFGDGNQSIDINPIHTFTNNGLSDSTFQVELIAIGEGCSDTSFFDFTVFPQPQVQFVIDEITACYPVEVRLKNLSFGADSYLWDYGDGTTDTVSANLHTVTYTNATQSPFDVTISLNGQNSFGCENQSDLLFTVLPELQINVAFDTLACNPLEVDVINQSIGVVLHNWDFGDGIFDFTPEPTHTYVTSDLEDEIFYLKYIARGYEGCSDTLVQPVYVLQVPEALFTANPSTQTLPNATVTINDLSQRDSVSYYWDFGDGNFSNDPELSTYTYESWGEYTLSLLLDNSGCQSYYEQSVSILPTGPIANFTGTGSGCEPFTLTFENLSLYATSYAWDFGDGGQSTLENPTYTYNIPGDYTVSLTAYGPGGENTLIVFDSVQVYSRATAFFTLSKDEIFIPNDPLTCFNLSQNADRYFWDFGDGSTSLETNPIHYYTTEGIFPVTLTSNNINDCPHSYTLDPAVTASASGEIAFPNAFTPNPYGSNGGVYDPNDVSSDLNDVFHPVYSGIVQYQLWIFNRWGELIFVSNDINIGWDGYYKGSLVQQDVYVWKVKAVTVSGTVINDAGDLTLIR